MGQIIEGALGTVSTSAPQPESQKAAAEPAIRVDIAIEGTSKPLSPAVQRAAQENPSLNLSQMTGSGKDGRLLKGDVLQAVSNPQSTSSPASVPGVRRVAMTTLRKRIADEEWYGYKNVVENFQVLTPSEIATFA